MRSLGTLPAPVSVKVTPAVRSAPGVLAGLVSSVSAERFFYLHVLVLKVVLRTNAGKSRLLPVVEE